MQFPIDALRTVVVYLWNDEEGDYKATDPNGDHVFLDLQKLRAWLDSQVS